jgi:hypothetical protein
MYGIIGAGNIGGTLARLLTEAGEDVLIANSRGPETLRAFAEQLGDHACPETVEQVIERADVVIEAVPYGEVDTLPADELAGKILISASNYFPGRDGDIEFGGRSETERLADLYPETSIAKAFNTVPTADLAEQGEPEAAPPDRRVVPYVASDERARQAAHDVIHLLGFGPLYLGGLEAAEGLIHPNDVLFGNDLSYKQATTIVQERTGD